MTQISFEWTNILKMAIDSGIPNRPRAILREYLQVILVEAIYQQSLASKLSFIGGTALRLMRNIPRFSEDLDFDNLGVNNTELEGVFSEAAKNFKAVGIAYDLKNKSVGEKQYFEIKFPNLLFDLKITTNDKEKLMIKLDSSTSWVGQKPEKVMMNRLGRFGLVQTNPIEQILVQKLRAYVERKQTQPRDMYDVMWLIAQGAKLDKSFMQANHCEDLVMKAKRKFEQERANEVMKRRLEPFLFEPKEADKIEGLGMVLEEM